MIVVASVAGVLVLVIILIVVFVLASGGAAGGKKKGKQATADKYEEDATGADADEGVSADDAPSQQDDEYDAAGTSKDPEVVYEEVGNFGPPDVSDDDDDE
jgi:hypothetical protein